MNLYLTPINIGEVTVIEAAGRITLGANTTSFRKMIHDLTAGGRKKILLNLADVTYIDSSGIGELIAAFMAVKHHGGAVKLLNPAGRVYDLLHITIRGCGRSRWVGCLASTSASTSCFRSWQSA